MANLLSLLALSKPAGATPSKHLETWPIPLSLTISTCQFMWVCIMSTHLQVDPIPLSQPSVFLFHYNIAHHSQFQMLSDICHSVFVVKSLRIIKLWMKFIVLVFWSKLLKKLQLWVTKHCDLNFHIVSSRESSLCLIRNIPQSHLSVYSGYIKWRRGLTGKWWWATIWERTFLKYEGSPVLAIGPRKHIVSEGMIEGTHFLLVYKYVMKICYASCGEKPHNRTVFYVFLDGSYWAGGEGVLASSQHHWWRCHCGIWSRHRLQGVWEWFPCEEQPF